MIRMMSVALAAAMLLALTDAPGAQTGGTRRTTEADRRSAREPDWRLGPQNDPNNCKSLWQDIGLPKTSSENGKESFHVCHTAYVVLHNFDRKTPDWVIENLTKAQVSGDNDRPGGGFKPDPNLPESAQAKDKDYTHSPPFARGHQAPSEDFNVDADLMRETFLFSNVVPQVSPFNSGIWQQLEKRVRELAKQRGRIVVVTGPIYQTTEGGEQTIAAADNPCNHEIKLDPPPSQKRKKVICTANNENPRTACTEEDGVAVPAALYKVVYDPKLGRANAYILPNIDYKGIKSKLTTSAQLETYRTSVSVVEDQTGLRFFSAMSARDQLVRKKNCTATMLH